MKKLNGFWDRIYLVFFAWVLLCAVLLRLSLVSVERMWPDEALYAWTAMRIFENPQLIFSKEIMDFHPPLFSILLGFAHFFFEPLTACRVSVFLINILGIVGVFFLGVRLSGPFLGCYAAMALSFNMLYFNMSNFILIDGVVSVFLIFFFYVLTFVEPKKLNCRDLLSGLAVVALLLLKWSAGLVLPFLFLYYLIAFKEMPLAGRIMKSAVPMSFAAVLIGLLLWRNHVILGAWVPQVFTAANESYRQPLFFYAEYFVNKVFPGILLPFLMVGIISVFKSGDRNRWAHGLWIVFAFVFLSVMKEKDFRFMLMLTPSFVIVSGLGLEAVLALISRYPLGHRLLRFLALIAIFFFLVFGHFEYIKRNVLYKAFMYTGYREAGEAVKVLSESRPQAMILASSVRMIRYFSGINFGEFGGRLYPIPATEEEFVRLVSASSSDIILVVDRWEMSQPKWIWPPTDRNNQFLKQLDFSLENRIQRRLFKSGKLTEKISVIWILKKSVSNIQRVENNLPVKKVDEL